MGSQAWQRVVATPALVDRQQEIMYLNNSVWKLSPTLKDRHKMLPPVYGQNIRPFGPQYKQLSTLNFNCILRQWQSVIWRSVQLRGSLFPRFWFRAFLFFDQKYFLVRIFWLRKNCSDDFSDRRRDSMATQKMLTFYFESFVDLLPLLPQILTNFKKADEEEKFQRCLILMIKYLRVQHDPLVPSISEVIALLRADIRHEWSHNGVDSGGIHNFHQ